VSESPRPFVRDKATNSTHNWSVLTLTPDEDCVDRTFTSSKMNAHMRKKLPNVCACVRVCVCVCVCVCVICTDDNSDVTPLSAHNDTWSRARVWESHHEEGEVAIRQEMVHNQDRQDNARVHEDVSAVLVDPFSQFE